MMNAVSSEIAPNRFAQSDEYPIVVVGAGPVGVRFCQELARQSPQQSIILYGEEPWDPYNRVKLSSLLAGEMDEDAVSTRPAIDQLPQVETRYNTKVIDINPALRLIRDDRGRTQVYSSLILATGASPRIPTIEGIDMTGVYSFRNMRDVQYLKARQVRSRHVVVLGGGLLGLETARAMRTFNTRVTLIEHNTHLMFRQLDEPAAEILREHVMLQGIEVLLRDSIKTVNGSSVLESVTLRSGRVINCDTLILATGIQPNISLAKEASIAIGRGIKVDEKMRTSHSGVYAIGECVEFNQRTYGTVSPGYEQAAVAASNISGRAASYVDSSSASRLKVVDCAVYSLGDIDDSARSFSTYQYSEGDVYRRLNISRGRILGVVAMGPWDELGRIQEMVNSGRRIWPWQLARFKKYGHLWDEESQSVSSWSPQAVVCNCTGVTCGQIRTAIQEGCRTVEQISSQTGASSVCGTCRPLLVEIAGDQAPQQPERGYKPLIVGSTIALLLALLTFFSPRIPLPDTVQLSFEWHRLWTDTFVKQISGFTLLGLSVIAAIVSLRKRVKWVKFGDFTGWRIVHVVVGALIVIGLTLHTGFRLGDNLNFWLMLSYSGMLLSGAIIGGVIALQHRLRASQVKALRGRFFWIHILLFWPLPALLCFHILKSYYY